MKHMNSKGDILRMCSAWYEQLSGSPQLKFADLSKLRQTLGSDGAYVIWLRLKEDATPLCLKIGKAQRTRGLHPRLNEHWGSREKPTPNVLAQHLMRDDELGRRTSLDLKNLVQRKRLLEDWCTFQALPFGFSITPREVAILECFLTVKLLPRYIGPGDKYPSLPDFGGEDNPQ